MEKVEVLDTQAYSNLELQIVDRYAEEFGQIPMSIGRLVIPEDVIMTPVLNMYTETWIKLLEGEGTLIWPNKRQRMQYGHGYVVPRLMLHAFEAIDGDMVVELKHNRSFLAGHLATELDETGNKSFETVHPSSQYL